MVEAAQNAADPTWRLQRCMTDLLLDADSAQSFADDPRSFGEARGLGSSDLAALEEYKSQLLVYRDLARTALEDPLPDCFPITHALLEEAGRWRDCLEAFLASRSIQSPYYRDVNPTFVAWLASSGWGQDRWSFLLQLAHFEYIEVEILRWPDEPPPAGLAETPATGSRVVFDGAARNLAYTFRVHEATKEEPAPEAGEAFLLGYRDAEGDFLTSELSAHASAFLARCLDGETVGAAAAALGLDEAEVLELLIGLKKKGALLGFR